MDELVSVVITTYRRSFQLERALKSVLAQTYKYIEVIVVDDNKEEKYHDEVQKIVNKFEDSRVRLIINEHNLGGALSRNVGIEISKGKYVAFLDDDDEYFPEKVEKQIECFKFSKQIKLGLVYCYTLGCGEAGNIKDEYKYNYIGNCIFEGMKDCIAATSQWMCLKEALLDVGGFTDTPCKQDSVVIVKLLVKGYSLDRVPEFLTKYYDFNCERISTNGNPQKRIDGEELLRRLCRENYSLLSLKEREEVEYNFSCRLLLHYLSVGDYKKAKRELLFVLRLHTLSRKSLGVYKSIFKHGIKCWIKK